jgi:hypothetical protein
LKKLNVVFYPLVQKNRQASSVWGLEVSFCCFDPNEQIEPQGRCHIL